MDGIKEGCGEIKRVQGRMKEGGKGGEINGEVNRKRREDEEGREQRLLADPAFTHTESQQMSHLRAILVRFSEWFFVVSAVRVDVWENAE